MVIMEKIAENVLNNKYEITNVCKYLRRDRILIDLNSRSKKGAILEITNLLKSTREIANLDAFISDIFERERLGTTAIGEGIALPHARTDAVKNIVMAFGRSKKGVEFDSLDGGKVNLIFLIGTPKKDKQGVYLKILADLSKTLKKKQFRELLLAAENQKEILRCFHLLEGYRS